MIYQRQLAVPGYWEDITREQWEKAKREDTRVLYTAEPVAQGEVMVDFAGIGLAGPFPIKDGKIELPQVTLDDLCDRIPLAAQSRAVPDGWKLVPREPTATMCGVVEYGAASRMCETFLQERMDFLRKAIVAAPQPGEST